MAVFGQIILLLWKNWLIQRRSPIWTLFEIIIPSAVTCLLLLPAYLAGDDFEESVGTKDLKERYTYSYRFQPRSLHGTSFDFEPKYKHGIQRIIEGPRSAEEQGYTGTMSQYWTCNHVLFEQIYYSPDTEPVRALMEKVVERLSHVPNITEEEIDVTDPDFMGGAFSDQKKQRAEKIGRNVYVDPYEKYTWDMVNMTISAKGFKNEKEMQDALEDEFGKCNSDRTCSCKWLWGGVAFDSDMRTNDLRYKIRLPNNRRDYNSVGAWSIAWNTRLHYGNGNRGNYRSTGFLTLQRAIDLAWAQSTARADKADQVDGAQFWTEQLPQRYFFPPTAYGQYLILFILYYAFLVMLIFTVRTVVHEKEQGLREYMKVMGLRNWVQWLSHFIASFIKLAIFSVIVTFVLTVEYKGMRVFTYTDPSFLFAFMLILSAGLICYAFAVSVFFQSATPAMACGGIVYFLLSIFAMIIMTGVLDGQTYEYTPWSTQKLMTYMLLNNYAMTRGVVLILQFESKGVGMQWKYLFETLNADENLSMGLICGMVIIDMIICILVTWYVDAIYPGQEGVPQKIWFPFMPAYWCGGSRVAEKDFDDIELEQGKGATVEPVPPTWKAAIDIKNLVKSYGNGVVAVNGLNLQIYPDQITALLGHNGAGKTTTMKILSGILPPTSGNVSVIGYNLKASLPTIRQKLGLCPQHNILFSMLTVEEHLKLFCKLKGRTYSSAEADRMLEFLKLTEKKKKQVKTLSGGMKRKVLVAVALIGGSEVVFLDEPTSGLDPAARHSMWEFLKKERTGRTMILSTHFMEEADILGDRIAIIAKGQLQCCGSSMFLKKHYGTGYNLTVAFKESESDGTKSKELISLVRNHCHEARLESALGMEATIVLPRTYSNRFAAMFADLEGSQQKLGISSFGIAITTMEDVFLKVGELAEKNETGNNDVLKHDGTAAKEVETLRNTMAESARMTGVKLWIQQFKGHLIKKFHLCRRYWVLAIPQLIVPIFFGFLCVLSYRPDKVFPDSKVESPTNMPSLLLSLGPFGSNNFLWHFDGEGITSDLAKTYDSIISGNSDLTKVDVGSKGIENYTLDHYQVAGLYEMERYMITGVSLGPEINVTAFYQGQTQHGESIATNLFDTALLRYVTGDMSAKIETINHPMPWGIWAGSQENVDQEAEEQVDPEIPRFARFLRTPIIMLLVFGLAFLVSSFVVLLVKERASGAKHLQILTGCPQPVFWLANCVWDLITFMIPVTVILILFVVFDVGMFVFYGCWAPLLVVFVLYGIASITRAYLFSFMFDQGAKAFLMSAVICIVLGLPMVIVADELDRFERYMSGSKMWEPIVGIIFPNYCLGRTLNYISQYAIDIWEDDRAPIMCPKGKCNKSIELPSVDLNTTLIYGSERPGIRKFIYYFLLQCLFYWALVTLAEFGVFKRFWARVKEACGSRKTHQMVEYMQQKAVKGDADTEAEADLVRNMKRDDAPLMIRYLTKMFRSFIAVDGISFHVRQSDCFGLLGVNGAGKTTTFEMLIGNHTVSGGEALIATRDAASNWRSAGTNLGYCPQFDALIDNLTGNEMLRLFARLRGIPESKVGDVVDSVVRAVGIEKYAPRMTKTYSGGNKRRLSLGLALVGLPQVLLLDEPTTGVDPAARRAIWDILAELRKHGVAILLSSHSMEECDALCTRIAIMVRGRLVCIGSSQHLKTKYGAGCSLQLKVDSPDAVVPVQQAMAAKFPGSVLKEMHEQVLIYELSQDSQMTWSAMFTVLEEMVGPLKIIDYSLSQTTLEQVFLRFSREGSPAITVGVQPKPQLMTIESVN